MVTALAERKAQWLSIDPLVPSIPFRAPTTTIAVTNLWLAGLIHHGAE
jgi:hypothetical protein